MLSGLEWWQIALGVVVGLIILVVLVVLHELGHMIVALRNGVDVEEFGIGFPPRAKAFGKYKKTLLTLNWLPLGGFCKMKGESDEDTGKGTFGAASFWSKTKILFAGVFANFLTAVVLFMILAFFGIPKLSANQFAIASDNHGAKGVVTIDKVIDGSAAAKAGLKAKDNIVSVDGVKTEFSTQVPEITKKRAGQKIAIVVERHGKEQSIDVQLAKENKDGKGILGVTTYNSQSATIKATWSAPIVAIVDTLQLMWMTIAGIGGMIGNLFMGLWGLVTGSGAASTELAAVSDSVSGPIGILGYIFPTALAGGALTLLYISAIIALSLAVMNILPIPGLDGGRWYLIAWYHLRGKKLTKEKEETVVGYGMMVLFVIIILATIADISKLF